MFDRLEQLEDRYKELEADLSDPKLVSDQQRYQKTTKQHRDMEPVIERFREYKRVRAGIADAKIMLAEDDADMRSMAEEELAGL
jgi:peptide chain release factor 1